MPRLPRTITAAPLRTVRPQDLTETYARPHASTAQLVARGDLLRLARGYLVAVPDDARPGWHPGTEAAALGIAVAIFGQASAVLMGISAARIHHAYPRALGSAVVAVPEQHRPIHLDSGGTVHFVARNTERLDAILERLETGSGLVTTPEQTALDLAKRPGLGGQPQGASEALWTLARTVDLHRVLELAEVQHAPTAGRRVAEALVAPHWTEISKKTTTTTRMSTTEAGEATRTAPV